MTRKPLFYSLLLALAPLLYSCNPPVDALLVVGGHSYDTAEFFDLFGSLDGIRVEPVSQPEALDVLSGEQVSGYDVLIFYDFVPDMDPADSTIYLDLARKGIPMLFLHHSICTFQKWEGFGNLVGGKYRMPEYYGDPDLHSGYTHDLELPVTVVDPTHPVTHGLDDFRILDEGYTNLWVKPGVVPLLQTDHPRCHPLAGWVHRYLHSTVVYLIFGHDRHAYENPVFGKLLHHSVHWLSQQHETAYPSEKNPG